MAIQDPDWSEAVPMNEEVDEETLAAIDQGIRDADEGRLFTVEEARERLGLPDVGGSARRRPTRVKPGT
jgi:hypothetical protein